MYRIRTDSEKNRLLLALSGFVTVEEALVIKEVMAKEIPKLTPGFDVINDISNFRMGQEPAGKILQDIIRFCISHNVGRVVRVVGASQAGLIQFANFTGKIDSYNVKYVPTMKDAETALEKKLAV
jgi:hypothetical protein